MTEPTPKHHGALPGGCVHARRQGRPAFPVFSGGCTCNARALHGAPWQGYFMLPKALGHASWPAMALALVRAQNLQASPCRPSMARQRQGCACPEPRSAPALAQELTRRAVTPQARCTVCGTASGWKRGRQRSGTRGEGVVKQSTRSTGRMPPRVLLELWIPFLNNPLIYGAPDCCQTTTVSFTTL